MQSIIALCGKLIRVFYGLLRNGTDYSAEKMLGDIELGMRAAAARLLIEGSELLRRSNSMNHRIEDTEPLETKSRESQVEFIHQG